MSKTVRALPKLAELHQNPEEAFKNDELNLLLNQPPHETWLKKHPMIQVKNEEGKNVKLQYIPIDKIEFMLTRIFQKWKREVLSVQLILNSVVVTVRLWYMNPVTLEWDFHDGVGACPVQTDQGASASNMSALKTAGVQIAAPAAVSYALKDAAECLGKLFGKDLNKTGTMDFKGAYMGEMKQEAQLSNLTKEKVATSDQEDTDNEFEL